MKTNDYLSVGEVLDERARQDAKWGQQNHHALEWLAIIGEELGEANKAAAESHWRGETWANYRTELIQVAAVAIAAVQSLDRDGSPTVTGQMMQSAPEMYAAIVGYFAPWQSIADGGALGGQSQRRVEALRSALIKARGGA